MRERLAHAFLRLACAGTLVLAACGYQPPLAPLDPDLLAASQALDHLKWYLDAYGTASLTNPILVLPDDSFKFSLTQANADTFFTTEKSEISGRSAGSDQSALSFGLSGQGSLDLAAMQQYLSALSIFNQNQAAMAAKQQIQNQAAYQQYQAAVQTAQSISDPVARANAVTTASNQLAQSLAGPAPGTANPFPAAPSSPSLPAPTAAPSAAASMLPSQFAAPQSLFGAGVPAVSADTRSALIMAAGDNATNAILAMLGDASKISKFASKRVMFGVSMVSVNPGWKTRHGYSADVQTQITYGWRYARPLVRAAFLAQKSDSPVEEAALQQLQSCVATSFPSEQAAAQLLDAAPAPPAPFDQVQFAPYVFHGDLGHQPVVAAISPMGDALSFDFQSSKRRSREIALQIAMSLSYAGLASQASSFLSYADQQQRDIETRTSNVIVNGYGTHLGVFGFHVYPRMTADPSSASNSVLDLPAFPTLLVLGADDGDLQPRVLVVGHANDDAPAKAEDKKASTPLGDKNGSAPLQCLVVEPVLKWNTQTRWAPESERCQGNLLKSPTCVGDVWTEEERFRVLGELWDRLWIGLDPGHSYARKAAHHTFCVDSVKRIEQDFQRAGIPLTPCDSKYCRRNDKDKGANLVQKHIEECEGLLEEKDGALVAFLNSKAELFNAILSGARADVDVPSELLVPPAATVAAPSVGTIAPEAIDLEQDGVGAPKPQSVQLLIAGKGLDQMDLTKTKVVVGDIDWLKDDGTVTQTPSAKSVGNAVALHFQVKSYKPVAFALSVKNSSTVIVAPPLVVNPPKDAVIERTSTDAANRKTTEMLHFTKAIPDHVLKSEIEKDKKVYPQQGTANVSVGVQATDGKGGAK